MKSGQFFRTNYTVYLFCSFRKLHFRVLRWSQRFMKPHFNEIWFDRYVAWIVNTRCTIGQSAVLRSHVVCPPVRLSVTMVDCDHIGWNSSTIISLLVSVGRSLSADPNIMDLLQVEIWAQSDPPLVDLSVGDIGSQIAAEWLQTAQQSQWRAYRKRTLLPPKWGSHMLHDTRMAVLASALASTSRNWPRPRPRSSSLGLGLGLKVLASFNITANCMWRRNSLITTVTQSHVTQVCLVDK